MSTAPDLPLAIDELRELLRAGGVLRARLFGSYARGEQTAESDVDLLIEPAPGLGLLGVFALATELEERTGVRFELATDIREPFRRYVEPDLIDLGL